MIIIWNIKDKNNCKWLNCWGFLDFEDDIDDKIRLRTKIMVARNIKDKCDSLLFSYHSNISTTNYSKKIIKWKINK